jgi:biotin carboxyl carrier protein
MSNTETKGKKGRKTAPPLQELEIGSVGYSTRLTLKFINRRVWQRPDERMVLSVIPGTIQKIMAKEGDDVDPGTPLLILEAMKMRNEVKSPIHGVISRIHVREGEQVPKAHLLVEFS